MFSLPQRIRRTLRALLRFLSDRIELASTEAREAAARGLKLLLLGLVGLLLLGLAYLLALAGLAVWLVQATPLTWASCLLLLGGLHTLFGAFCLDRVRDSAKEARSPFPETRSQFEADRQWFQKEKKNESEEESS
ncbi:MAG: phage holin family protein [Verrucomicrobiota bacterium]